MFDKRSISQSDNLKLNILRGEFVACDSTWDYQNVITPFSRMYYLTDGEGFLIHNGNKIPLKPGYLNFIPPGLSVDLKCDNRMEKYFFHVNLFSSDYIDVFSECKEIISFETNRTQLLEEIFTQSSMASAMLLTSYIYEDLYKVAMHAGMENIKIKHYSELIQKAIAYINTHLSVKLRVKEISEFLYVAPSTLSKHFYEETGMSIGRYIDLRIQFESEKLLAAGELSIEQISEKLGFCDRFYFTRKFKAVMLTTPAKYRKATEKPREFISRRI